MFRATSPALLLACALIAAAPPVAICEDGGAPAQEGAPAGAPRPGDDFFAHANAGWLAATGIPAGKARWGAVNEIGERTRQQIATLLDDARTAPPGSPARKVADFHAAWLNDAAIEARGLRPLDPLLRRIDRIRDKSGLAHYLGSELAADVDPLNAGVYESSHLLGLAVQQGNHGEKNMVAYLLQGGLGLPARADYLSDDPGKRALRAQYETTIGAWLAALDVHARRPATETARRAAAVLALETGIARSHATPEASADEHNADTTWARADFAREAPGLDWTAFFAAAGLARQPAFVVWHVDAVRGAAALVAQQPVQAWQDYLRIRAVTRFADVLPRAVAQRAMALRENAAGTPQAAPRTQRALAATQAAMGEALGRIYVERHFPPASKARVQAITRNVIAAFAARLEKVDWMAPASKAIAGAKLQRLYFGIGYPERWEDLSGLAIDPADPVGNLRRVAQRDYARAIARLGRPVDTSAWVVAPHWTGGMLVFQLNAYNFTAALLQAPKFDAQASDAANYGAIGAIVGHEVSHFVDTLGADYDPDGGARRWWTDADLKRYQAATEPLVRQVSACRPLPHVAVDGRASLSENLADLGGLAAAFDAYRATLGASGSDRAYVREQDRQFFLGFARAWRAKYRDDALAAQAASDHAPESCRVATVRNMDAWYEAFDVTPDQDLYVAPEARLRIW